MVDGTVSIQELPTDQKRFETCSLLLVEFDCPEVARCGRQDVRIQKLTNLFSFFLVLSKVLVM